MFRQRNNNVTLRRKRGQQNDRKKCLLSIPKFILSVIALNLLIGGWLLSNVSNGHDDNLGKHDITHADELNDQRVDIKETKKYEKKKEGKIQYHMVFSTDCSPYQHWQSYLFFYQAKKIDQPGFITRIASGCTDQEADEAQKWHNTHVHSVLSNNFRIHFTPHFSTVKNSDGTKKKEEYKFFNKPFGLKHWIEHGEGLNHVNFQTDHDVIVILVDPDMLLLRPIGADFPIVDDSDQKERKTRVSAGVPFAQKYGLQAKWTQFILTAIAGEDSPAKEVSYTEAMEFYPAGPPYIATASDMYKIAVKWAEFAPLVHAQYPHLLAEMYAYCVAAAHLRLPHQILTTLMVSNTHIGRDEGWHLSIDSTAPEEICQFASSSTINDPLPTTLHYCQRNMLGYTFFGKRRLPQNFFTCGSPLLAEPPMDLAVKYDFAMPPKPGTRKDFSPVIVKREAFMLCTLIPALNEAGEFFKKNHCDGVEGTNLDRTLELQKI